MRLHQLNGAWYGLPCEILQDRNFVKQNYFTGLTQICDKPYTSVQVIQEYI